MDNPVESKDVKYIERNYRIEIHRDEDCYMGWDDLGDLPIWMYEHSGTTIKACSSNPYSCPWDSGCAGLIACSKDKILKEYGNLSEETIQKVKDVMVSEIHELDLLYQGDVYGYIVIYVGEDGEEEEIASCWGFITEWNKLDFVFEQAEAEAIADAKSWYRKNGIQLRIPFPKDEGEE